MSAPEQEQEPPPAALHDAIEGYMSACVHREIVDREPTSTLDDEIDAEARIHTRRAALYALLLPMLRTPDDRGAQAARELTQQAQELGLYSEPASSALDRVLLWAWAWHRDVPGLPAHDILAAQKELDRLRADLADVARLGAWLRGKPFYRDVSWGRGAFRTFYGVRAITAPSLPALGAAVATEGAT